MRMREVSANNTNEDKKEKNSATTLQIHPINIFSLSKLVELDPFGHIKMYLRSVNFLEFTFRY